MGAVRLVSLKFGTGQGAVVEAATAACASPKIKLKTTQQTGSNEITTESFDAALAGLGCADRSLPYPIWGWDVLCRC